MVRHVLSLFCCDRGWLGYKEEWCISLSVMCCSCSVEIGAGLAVVRGMVWSGMFCLCSAVTGAGLVTKRNGVFHCQSCVVVVLLR